jgi:anti-anti-sigma regulatory factor
MLKITRFSNGEVVFRLSGRMDAENLNDLEALLNAESGDGIVLDLKDLTLVDHDVVRFLRHCETDSDCWQRHIHYAHCRMSIRERLVNGST